MTYNLVFGVHIPKTGITSIVNTYSLLHPEILKTQEQVIGTHQKLYIKESTKIIHYHPQNKVKYTDIYKHSPYIFTFFRNPYQRALSLYSHNLENKNKFYDMKNGESITDMYKSFFDVISFKEVINCLETKVNYIGFYENYHKDVEKLFSNVGIPYDIKYLYHIMKTKEEYKKQGRLQCSEEEFISIYEEDYILYNYFWEKK